MAVVRLSAIPLDPVVLNKGLIKYLSSKTKLVKKMTYEKTRDKMRKLKLNTLKYGNKEMEEKALAELWNRNDEELAEFRVAYPSPECEAYKELVKSDNRMLVRYQDVKHRLSEERAYSMVTKKKIMNRLKLDKLRVIRSVYLALNKHVIQYSLHALQLKHFKFLKVMFNKANEFIKDCKEVEIDTGYDKRQQKYIQSVKKTLEVFVSIYKDRREKIMELLKDDAGLKKKMPYDMLRYIAGFVGN